MRSLDEVPTTDAPAMLGGDEDPEAIQATVGEEEVDGVDSGADDGAEDAPFEEINL